MKQPSPKPYHRLIFPLDLILCSALLFIFLFFSLDSYYRCINAHSLGISLRLHWLLDCLNSRYIFPGRLYCSVCETDERSENVTGEYELSVNDIVSWSTIVSVTVVKSWITRQRLHWDNTVISDREWCDQQAFNVCTHFCEEIDRP